MNPCVVGYRGYPDRRFATPASAGLTRFVGWLRSVGRSEGGRKRHSRRGTAGPSPRQVTAAASPSNCCTAPGEHRRPPPQGMLAVGVRVGVEPNGPRPTTLQQLVNSVGVRTRAVRSAHPDARCRPTRATSRHREGEPTGRSSSALPGGVSLGGCGRKAAASTAPARPCSLRKGRPGEGCFRRPSRTDANQGEWPRTPDLHQLPEVRAW